MTMDRQYAYVGCRTTRERDARGKGIGVYSVDSATGAWSLVDIVPTLDNPSFLALNPDQTVLYTVHGDGDQVSAFRIDASSGRLTPLNSRSCEGRNPVHLDLSKCGRWLAIANYATGNVTRLAIAADGALGEPSTTVALEGSPGPHRTEQASSHPHQIARYSTRQVDSDWHIVPDKALDIVFAIRWQDDGHVQTVANRWRPGSGPRHAAFHPTQPLIYVANELDSTMTTWALNRETGQCTALGTVSLIPGEFDGVNSAAGIAITPSGRTLYVSNRGHDSVATLRLDPVSGRCGAPTWTSTFGQFPRFLCVSPSGRDLYVANERSDAIIQYAIDEDRDAPAPTGVVIETGSPVCIVFKTR
ncbi:lactonase family protein [Pandoraea sp. XJJ-1]|uniref:lactonase family protein n=1 Tax=Pandoraea sp. XJJ-1 TaxID=3002643 RepID=UPI002280BF3F|nr:lactonase family protein [Pandoraea sp. XJJ-1]WAL81235.1 lactonase family protein [Pandoraea sp. XJJ-1]